MNQLNKFINISLALIFIVCYNSFSQKFQYGFQFGFSKIQYSFPDKSDPYKEADIKPFPLFHLGTTLQLMISETFRIGTGVHFLKAKGKSDEVYVRGKYSNPNSEGYLTLDIDNSYLMFPLEFIYLISKKAKIRPLISAGLNFYKPLGQSFIFDVVPKEEPNPFYDLVHSEIKKEDLSQLNGFLIGTGVIIPVKSKTELIFRINYRLNNSFYRSTIPKISTELRSAKFKILEFSLGYAFL